MESNQFSGAYSRRIIERMTSPYVEDEIRSERRTHEVCVHWDRELGRVTSSGDNMQDCVITVEHGNTIKLEATPDQGSHFAHWISSALAYRPTSNPLVVTVDKDMDITAIFVKDGIQTPPTAQANTQVSIIDRIVPVVKKWWWAIAIAAYVIYSKKGGKE